jgi:beta-phosphoglucomutase
VVTSSDRSAVIWDVDGTLVDTAELHFQAWVALAQELGKPFTRADFTATFGLRNPEIIPRLFAISDERQVAALGERKETLYRTAALQGVALLPGVLPLLESLRQASFLQAVGSSAPRANLELILRLTETADFFTALVSMEDTQRGKPDPEVFLAAAGKLGVAAERCLVIEDAPAGVQAARAGGMKCIAVNFIPHHSTAILYQAGANRVLKSLEEVTADTIIQVLTEK